MKYIIVAMILWPLVGFLAFYVSAIYIMFLGVGVYDFDSLALNRFIDEIFETKSGGKEEELKGLAKWENRINNLIRWPILVHKYCKRAREIVAKEKMK